MHSHRLTSMDPGLQRSDATTQAYTFATSAASSKYFHGVDRTFPLPRRGWCAGIRFIPTRNRSGVLLRACQGEWRAQSGCWHGACYTFAGTFRETTKNESGLADIAGARRRSSINDAALRIAVRGVTCSRRRPSTIHSSEAPANPPPPCPGPVSNAAPRIRTSDLDCLGQSFFFTQAWNRWALPRAHSPPTLAHGAAPRAGNAGNVRHRAPCGGVCGDQTLAEELFWRGARPCGRICAQRRSTACGKAGDIASWAIASCSHSRPLTRRNAPMSPSLEECSREAISACVMRMARRSPTEKSTATSNQRRPAGDSAEGAIR